jgi:hypothetical protein
LEDGGEFLVARRPKPKSRLREFKGGKGKGRIEPTPRIKKLSD